MEWLNLLLKLKVKRSIWGFSHSSFLHLSVFSTLCSWQLLEGSESTNTKIYGDISVTVIFPTLAIPNQPQTAWKELLNVRGNSREFYASLSILVMVLQFGGWPKQCRRAGCTELSEWSSINNGCCRCLSVGSAFLAHCRTSSEESEPGMT